MKLILLILLIVLLYILIFILNFKETFNSKSKKIRNIFATNIFENKTIFLIANNPNLSEKTKKFLNNYDYKDSLIVRFSGYKPIIKDYCRGKTDIMVYRKGGRPIKYFHGYNKNNYNKNIINVFTKDLEKNENEFDKYYDFEYPKFLRLTPLYTLSERNSFKNLNYPKKCGAGWSTGFNFLIYLLHLKNIKKIYLIGYSFHNKSDKAHCELWEYNYFKKNIKNKQNVEILL
jgi:hypothetical protein